jgi:hypothetical protein
VLEWSPANLFLLHLRTNLGNDAHYTLELFLWLARNNGPQRT